MGRNLQVILTLLIVLVCATTANAQFLAPVQVSSSSAGCDNPAIERDVTDNLAFAWDCAGDIFFTSSVFVPGVDVNVTNGTLASSRPDLVAGLGGQIRMAFDRESPQPSAIGNDVMTATNLGGPWGSPINLTFSDDADQAIRITDSAVSGDFSFTWWHTSTTGDEEVWLRRGITNPNELLAAGRAPCAAYDVTNTVHVVFERDGELYHLSHDGIALSGETPIGAVS